MIHKALIPQQIRIFLSLAIILIIGRVVLFHTSSLSYLFWNLFLACLPFAVSSALFFSNKRKKLSTIVFVIGMIAWLLLLPNAPYVVTDLIHIGYGHTAIVLYTSILIFVCALSGLALCMYSLSQMHEIFISRYSQRTASAFLIVSMFLVSFGICFGRFMRFNSWDIIVNPRTFLQTIGDVFIHPQLYVQIYIITATFFLCIFMMYSAWNINPERHRVGPMN